MENINLKLKTGNHSKSSFIWEALDSPHPPPDIIDLTEDDSLQFGYGAPELAKDFVQKLYVSTSAPSPPKSISDYDKIASKPHNENFENGKRFGNEADNHDKNDRVDFSNLFVSEFKTTYINRSARPVLQHKINGNPIQKRKKSRKRRKRRRRTRLQKQAESFISSPPYSIGLMNSYQNDSFYSNTFRQNNYRILIGRYDYDYTISFCEFKYCRYELAHMAINSGLAIQVEKCFYQNGLLHLICHTLFTFEFYTQMISNIPPRGDTVFIMVPDYEIPLTYAKFTVHGPLRRAKAILKLLEIQNPGLDTKSWTIISNTEIFGGSVMVVGLDNNTVNLLKNVYFMKFYLGARKVIFHLQDKC